jgi:hypothetical protein
MLCQARFGAGAITVSEGCNRKPPFKRSSFIGLTEGKQVEQFVTINREAKNVPTSLSLDLLRRAFLASLTDRHSNYKLKSAATSLNLF